jgi:hypothetical protein
MQLSQATHAGREGRQPQIKAEESMIAACIVLKVFT